MKAQVNILVTGATGFVGQALLSQLLEREAFNVTAALRSVNGFDRCEAHSVGDLTKDSDWSAAIRTQQVVIHTAARAHILTDDVADPLAEYRCVNVDGTLNLARQAAAAGVKRFIFVSSIKVNGEQTPFRQPFTAEDAPVPEDAYGISKGEAERALWDVSAKTGLEVVVLRPPLVYGPGVKGNLARLLKLVRSSVPLPLGAVHNQRSLIGLDNLVDLLIRCVDHPAAAGQTFLVSDGEDVSTPDLLRHMAAGMGRSARLVPVPVPLLRLAGRALGKQAEIDRLLGSLQIDSSHTQEVLNWTPPVSVAEGIRRMVPGA